MKVLHVIFFFFSLLSVSVVSAQSNITSASNGLTKSGTDVQLGGTLTQATAIDVGATFTFKFSKGTSNYFFLDNSGNIGIGTGSPTAQWHTTGSVRFQGLATNNTLTNILVTDANGNLSVRDAATIGSGGMTNPMTTIGDIIYGGTSGTGTRLAGNVTTTKKFLIQTGDGTNSIAPGWGTVSMNDIPGPTNQLVYGTGTGLASSARFSWSDPTSAGATAFNVFNSVAGQGAEIFLKGSRQIRLISGGTGYGVSSGFAIYDHDASAWRYVITPTGENLFGGYTSSQGSYVGQFNGNILIGGGIGSDNLAFRPDGSVRLAIGQESSYTGNYINSTNIDLKLKTVFAGGTGGNIIFMTRADAVGAAIDRGRFDKDGNFLVGYNTSQGSYVGQFNGGIYTNSVNRFNLNGKEFVFTYGTIDAVLGPEIGTLTNDAFALVTNGQNRVKFDGDGTVKVYNLSDGSGIAKMVTVTNGVLGYQTIPSGGGTNYWTQSGTNISYTTGNVSIGTTNSQGYRFAVNGDAIFTKIKVKQYSSWPDYVFEDGYKLLSLIEVEKYIQQNKHLPDVPSAAKVEENGLDLGDNQAVLLKKIEELTLYIIKQQKEIETLKVESKRINELSQKIEGIEEAIRKGD